MFLFPSLSQMEIELPITPLIVLLFFFLSSGMGKTLQTLDVCRALVFYVHRSKILSYKLFFFPVGETKKELWVFETGNLFRW